MQARLEDWIAGIQLAALGLRRAFSNADQLAVTGRQRFVADYFREEILAYLSDDRRRFLLQTGILGRLCGPLCEAVTRMEGGRVILETLEREALFLMPLDDQRAWFRRLLTALHKTHLSNGK